MWVVYRIKNGATEYWDGYTWTYIPGKAYVYTDLERAQSVAIKNEAFLLKVRLT